MPPLIHQRCLNHAAREAVARCPVCSRYFCRECITEHEGRVICATCLRALAKVPLRQRRGFASLVSVTQCALGLALAWLFFYLAGDVLLRLPSSFHEGTLWRVHWLFIP
jgi:hypothetical protein